MNRSRVLVGNVEQVVQGAGDARCGAGVGLQHEAEDLHGAEGEVAVLEVVGFAPESDEVAGHDAVAGRLSAVVAVLGAGEELLVIVGGEVEAAAFEVAVRLHGGVGECLRFVEPLLVAGGIVEVEQAVDEEGVILEEAVAAWGRLLAGHGRVQPQEATVLRPHRFQQEVGSLDRGVGEALLLVHFAGLRVARDHLAVPRRDDLGVEERPFALGPHGHQFRLEWFEAGEQFRLGDLHLLRDLGHRLRQLQDVVFLLEVGHSYAVDRAEERDVRIVAEDGFDLVGSPDVELTFLVVGVRVQGRVEAAFGAGHFALDEAERFDDDSLEVRVRVGAEGLGVKLDELGVVVEHFLEVGDGPGAFGAVAVEAAAELVVDAALGHFSQRELHGFRGRFVPLLAALFEEKGPDGGAGKLGAAKLRLLAARAAVFGVDAERFERVLHHVAVERDQRHEPRAAFERVHGEVRDVIRLLEDSVAILGEQFHHFLEDGFEAGDDVVAALLVVWREVGAAEDGLAFRREEHGHGPAARLAGDVQRRHVHVVHVGAFFPIDLDADEVLVEQLGHVRVRERLAFHDVAPVARRVADGQEDELLFLPGFVEGFLTPRVPVHGVVGVLEQVRAALLGQAIGFTFLHGLGCIGRGRCQCGHECKQCEVNGEADAHGKLQLGGAMLPKRRTLPRTFA